jgi:cardiolipin synthase A/B
MKHREKSLRRRRHFSVLRTLIEATALLALLEAVTVIILQLVSALRKHHRPERSFPHIDLSKVTLGENNLQIYNDGHNLYQAMLAAIDVAQESIYLETYIWKGDSVGQDFKDHLVRKAAQGVDVYVVFDSFANTVVPRSFQVFPPDIHVLKYQAIRRPRHLLDPRRYALDHRKLLIVDGSTAFVGGYNIGSLYETAWRDTHLRLQGPAVADFAQVFFNFWNHHHPVNERITRHYPRHFDPLLNVHGTDALRLTFPIRDMYIAAIDRAEHNIRLTNAYFVPDRILLDALREAAERGVDVQILVPWISNHVVVDWLARGYFTDCLKSGIRVFGYRQMLHAKTCTIDEQWSTIGTANLDRLSSVGNYEINVEIYSQALAQQMEALFQCDITNSWELTLDQWLKRPWYEIWGERILLPLRFLT